MLIPGSYGERQTLVWLVPLVRLVQVSHGACFALAVVMSGLTDFISEFRHFFIPLGSFAQLVHAPGWFIYELARA